MSHTFLIQLTRRERPLMKVYSYANPAAMWLGVGETEPADTREYRLRNAFVSGIAFAGTHGITSIGDNPYAPKPAATATPTEGEPTPDINVNWGAVNQPQTAAQK